jgi:hypothetical protein
VHGLSAAGAWLFEHGYDVSIFLPPGWAPGRCSDALVAAGTGAGGQRLLPCEQAQLADLAGRGLVVFSSPGEAGVDDTFSIDTAFRLGGALVSNDRYRDHQQRWAEEVAAAAVVAVDGDADMGHARPSPVAELAAAKLSWAASCLLKFTFRVAWREGASQAAAAAVVASGGCIAESGLLDLEFVPNPDDAARVATVVVTPPLPPVHHPAVDRSDLAHGESDDVASGGGGAPSVHPAHPHVLDDFMGSLPPASDIPWPLTSEAAGGGAGAQRPQPAGPPSAPAAPLAPAPVPSLLQSLLPRGAVVT